MKTICLLLALTATASAVSVPPMNCAQRPVQGATWPDVMPTAQWAALSEEVVSRYAATPFDWWNNVTPEGHTYNGNYLNSRVGKVIKENAIVRFKDGLPTVKYGEEFYTNPITTAQFALKAHSVYLKTPTPENRAAFLYAADGLIATQDQRGAYLHPFVFQPARNFTPYAAGWPSGMAQGQGLSVMARAYDLTGDAKYLESGNRAFDYLNIPTAQGGPRSDLGDVDPSLSSYLFIEEYPSDGKAQPSHVLNGFIFTTLGLYDWSKISAAAEAPLAGRYYRCSVATLKEAVRHYDLGTGVYNYDLGHLSTPERMRAGGMAQLSYAYEGIHIYLFLALESLTKDGFFLAQAQKLNETSGNLRPIPLK